MENRFDKNYIIGMVLMFIMFAIYMVMFSPEPIDEQSVETTQVSTETETTETTSETTLNDLADVSDPLNETTQQSDSLVVVEIPEKEITLENKNLRVVFSSKGGSIKSVILKDYRSYQDFINDREGELLLYDGTISSLDIELPTQNGMLNLSNLDYSTDSESSVLKDGETVRVNFTAQADGSTINKYYELASEGYGIKHSVETKDIGNKVRRDAIVLNWLNKLQVTENDIVENRKGTQVNYYNNENSLKYVGRFSPGDNDEKSKKPVKWFTNYQKYFSSGLVYENSYLENVKFDMKSPADDTTIVKAISSYGEIPYADIVDNTAHFTFYFGPNEINELKTIGSDYQKNLYLGYDLVKPINRYIFVPLFSWVESFVSNYGLLIIIVVLIIKLALTPLIYKSYMSSAKMRVLAPEIAELKEKVGDDQMKLQQETMKLYQQVGVNPLSGCIPMLLQMPILMSVFFLFPNLIMFRQKGFLWAKDLSTYDSFFNFGFNLPILGGHLSLFVLLMTASTMVYTYYNNQMTPDQPGPIDMKKISYIFPLVFLFVLNSYPAALAFYYLISNLVTILQQRVVKVFVNEDRIQTILDDNRRNYQARGGSRKNKFADFLEKQMQASEEMKKKNDQMKKDRKRSKK